MFLLNLTTPFYSINNYVWIQWFLPSGRLEKTCSIGATITPAMGLKGVCFTQKEKLYWSHLLSFNMSSLTHKGSKSSHTYDCLLGPVVATKTWNHSRVFICILKQQSNPNLKLLDLFIYFSKLGQMFICKPKCW